MRQRRGHAGFTLAEVVVTAAVIGVISAVAVSNYGRATERARWNAARDVLLAIYTGEQVYYNLNGKTAYYPPVPGGGGPFGFGALQACNGDKNCLSQWRDNIFVDDPNTDGTVTYTVWTDDTPASFIVFATYRGQQLVIDQDKTFSGTWNMP